jgi:8-amino-7-oxononanoate synthase
MSESWSQRMAAAVKKWGAAGPGLNGRYEAARLSDLSAYSYIKKVEKVGRMLSIPSPFFRPNDGREGTKALIQGKKYINFAWCNYLGLNEHPSVTEAAKTALDRYGTCISASRMVAGEIPLHGTLEEEIAEFCGTEAALLFVSGHAANVSTIGTIMSEGDLVVHDEFVHNSAVVGIQLSGATSRSFRHNNLDQCEKILREHRGNYQNALIIIEGLYSTEGDVPDLARLVEIKERYGAWLMVDDAHGLGVLGERGSGLAEHCGVDPRKIDILMGTLSKTLASCGGYIAGESALIEILKYTAPGFVYSVGLPPPMAAAALAALRVIKDDPARVARMRSNGALFMREARAAGLDTGNSQGVGILPVMVGTSLRVGKMTHRLFERGINASPIFSPGVPINAARLRYFVTSEHTPEEIRTTVRTTKEELDQC